MILYLIRHGKTVDFDERGWPLGDKNRYVSKEGLAALREAFIDLKEEIGEEDLRIFTSPYYRAKQTANVLQEVTHSLVEVKTFKEVTQADALLECLDEVREDVVCVISHEPSISQIIWDLTGKTIHVSMGTIHRLDFDKQEKKWTYTNRYAH